MSAHIEYALGRYLLAAFFALGAVQKILDPSAVQSLLHGAGLPQALIWPALVFNAVAAGCLVANRHIHLTARLLALYCVVTSAFHLIPSDPWQLSIFVKNWAIAGGLLILSSAAPSARQSPSKPQNAS
ncbi:MAG: DoxX protein [Rhodobacteraceae bacterium]|nr:DoxX protein [Paracoccaceae bacterium]MCW9043874.1 DoxX protein [Pseudopelagicola sp.]